MRVLTAVGAAVASPGDLLHVLRVDIVLAAVAVARRSGDTAHGGDVGPRRRQRLWATAITGTVTLAAFAAIVVVGGGVIGTLDHLPLVLLATQLLALMAIGWLIAAALADVTGRDAPGRPRRRCSSWYRSRVPPRRGSPGGCGPMQVTAGTRPASSGA